MKNITLRWLGLAAISLPLLVACSKPVEPTAAPAAAASAPSASAAPSPASPDLRVAIDPTYEPFTYQGADGKPTGFDVDFANALCEQIKRKCVFAEQVWDSMIPGLMAKKYDVIISSMGITEARLAQIDFSDRYYKTHSRMVLKKSVSYDGPASIKGKRIGVGKATIQEKWALGELKPAGVKVVSYDAQDQVYLDLRAGRIDGTVADFVEVTGGFLSKPEGQNYQLVGPELDDPKYFGIGVGIGLRKGNAELKETLNAGIQALRGNGVYKAINDKYFAKYGDLDVYGK
jgi:arginine/ornithine transport system substrate-binding protein